jgi:hypothetical protein
MEFRMLHSAGLQEVPVMPKQNSPCKPSKPICPGPVEKTVPIVNPSPVIDLSGTDKTSIPDPRMPAKNLPLPDGVSISIPRVWIGSIDDRYQDMDEIALSTKKLEEYGAGGLDRINFTIAAHLENLGDVASVAICVAWDPRKFPDKAQRVFQTNLKSSAYIEQDFRTEYLPQYINMRNVGKHELHIRVQLRNVSTVWEHKDGVKKIGEFPFIGGAVTRKIKIIVTA